MRFTQRRSKNADPAGIRAMLRAPVALDYPEGEQADLIASAVFAVIGDADIALTGGEGTMVDNFVQIGPTVVFSSVVLSPEWGRESQETGASSRRDQDRHAPSRGAAGAVRASRSEEKGSSAQLTLL